eukprot:scaffold6589_cov123-Cylindrotheca_fusiformis.AAC.5
MKRRSDRNRPERRKTRADPETGSIMSSMDDDASIMSDMSGISGISGISGMSGMSGFSFRGKKKKKKRRSSGASMADSVASFDFSDDDTIDTTQTPMPLKPVVPGEVNHIIEQRLDQVVSNENFLVLDLSKVELRPEDVDFVANALTRTKTLDNVILNKCRLRDDGLIKIAEALKKANLINLKSFSCRQNRIGNKGVQALAFLFEQSSTLEDVDLSENAISSKGAASILSSFHANPSTTLQTLNLSQNEIWDMDDGSFLRNNRTLKIFNLDGNFMHDEGAEQIASAIGENSNSQIEKLFLGWNGISDDGATALARMMELNSTLQVLGLAENDISNSGARAILSALAINTSVREISGLYHNQIDRKFIIVAIKRLLHRYGERSGNGISPTDEDPDHSDNSTGWAQQLYSDERHFDEKELEDDQGPSIALEAIEHWDWGTFGIEEIEASRHEPSTEAGAADGEATAVPKDLPQDRLTVFQSAPLAFFDRTSSEHHAVPIFDFEYEADAIDDALADKDDLGGVIHLNVENVTAGRFKVFFMQGISPIMHFSGIGQPDCVALENGFGYMQALPASDLKRFVKNGEGKVRVVVLNTCHARSMAESFLEAGVPHVICCQREAVFRDEGPTEFARGLYQALARDLTLKDAFNAGIDSVMRSTSAKLEGNINERFCLLPDKPADDPYHDVKVFYQSPLARVAPPPPIYASPLPDLPERFIGREVDMYEVLESLRVDDVVRIGGAPGCGKASVISAVSRYILERPKSFKIDSVFWLPAPEGTPVVEDEIYADLCALVDMTIECEDSVWEEEEFGIRRDRVTEALQDMRTILVIDGRMFTSEASGENLEMLLTHLLNEVSMKIVLLTAMEASKTSKTKTSRSEETMVNIGPLDLRASALLFGYLSDVVSASGNSIVHSAEEFADYIVPPASLKSMSMTENRNESRRYEKLHEMLGRGNPTTIASVAAEASEIDLRKILRYAKRPEVQVDSGNLLEDEIAKYSALKQKAIEGKNFARAKDYIETLEELESLRISFPTAENLEAKEQEYKAKFKEFLKAKKFSEANAMKKKILELKKAMLKEKHAKASEKAAAATPPKKSSTEESKSVSEVTSLVEQLKLNRSISTLDTSKSLADDAEDATLQIPRVEGSCALKISAGDVFDFDYSDGLSGFVCWSNESCDLTMGGMGPKVLEAGGNVFQEEVAALDAQATTEWGPVKCPTGEAVMVGPLTFSGLRSRFVFLAVGPLSPTNDDTEWDRANANALQVLEIELRASYRSALQHVSKSGVEAVCVPTLTSNPEGSAYERTLWVGLKTIIEEAKRTKLVELDIRAASGKEANLLIKMALGLGLHC